MLFIVYYTAHVELKINRLLEAVNTTQNDTFVVEDDEVQFVCSFRYFENVSSIIITKFRWYLNNDEILKAKGRLAIGKHKYFENKSTNSTLKFNKVSLIHSGE